MEVNPLTLFVCCFDDAPVDLIPNDDSGIIWNHQTDWSMI